MSDGGLNTGLMNSILNERYKIHSYEVDIKSRITLPVLCGYLQETAWHHVNNYKLGYEHLLKENKMWILSRLLIQMDTYPKWGDEIIIRTWHKGVKRLFGLRDFEILDANESPMGRAGTAWLVIDITSRRPQRPDPFCGNLPTISNRHAIVDDLEKIPLPATEEVLPPFTVRYSDLDLYSHVNNARYIEWVLNGYPIQKHREQTIRYFKIQYLSETLYGEEIFLRFHKADNTERMFIISAVKSSDKSEVFRALLQWEDNSTTTQG